MSRKKKFVLNTGTGILKQLIAVICGFILPRYMLLYYGSSVNGLVSSITQFLGFISLLEMGVGPVIQANLYEPLAHNDTIQISKIVISSERFFHKIAYVFLAYIAILAFIYPNFINADYDVYFTVSLLFIISISSFAQYFLGATYQLLLNADQKAYVQTTMQIITTVLNTFFCIILIKFGASIHIVKLLSATIFILRPIGQIIYVRRYYRLNKRIKLAEEPIKQKWNGFSQHLAAVVCGNSDIVVLTFFSTLASVSVYSVYYNVTNGVASMIMTAATGLESLFGNMIANNEKSPLLRTFEVVEFVVHVTVTIIFTVTLITIVPFVSVYTRGVTDANYIVPLFGALLVLAFAAQCLRVPYFRIIKAAGHFKQTQNGAYISMILNIVFSVALVFKLGLAGVATGTLAAMLYHTCYFVWYLRSNILNRSATYFIYYLFSDVTVAGLTIILARHIIMAEISYLAWVIMAVKVMLITLVTSIAINGLLYGKKIFKIIRGENFYD